MAGTLVKTVELDILVRGDGDAKSKLDAIDARAQELKRTFPEFTAKIDTAEAAAKLAVFKADLRDAAKTYTAKLDIDTSSVRGRLQSLAAGILGGGGKGGSGGLLGLLGGKGDGKSGGGAGAGGGALGGLESIAPGGTPITGAGAGILGAGLGVAALSGAGGIIPLLAAATLGVASFGALAIPTITAVTGAVGTLATDTAAYDAATTKAAKNTALAKIRADWAALDPAQKQAVRGIQSLQSAYDSMAAAFEPDVMKVFNAGLGVANKLLPFLLPLANAAAGAIAGLLANFDKFAGSAGFRSFMSNMTSLAGPAISALGEGFGKVAVSLGKLLLAMESPDALKILNGLFDALAGAINAVAAVFSYATPRVVQRLHDIADAFDYVRHNTASNVHQISDYIDTIRVVSENVGHQTAVTWNKTAAMFDDFRHRTAVVFDGVRSDIANIWDSVWNNTIGREQRGIADVAKLTDNLRHSIASIFDGVRHDIANIWDLIWNNTVGREQRGIADVIRWLDALPARITGIFARAGSWLTSFGSSVLAGFETGLEHEWNTVFSFFKGLPSKILSALGIKSPPQWAVDAGGHIMEGILKGLAHGASAIGPFFSGLASGILGGTAGVPGSSGNVTSWLTQALKDTGNPMSWLTPLAWLVNAESGGNPRAVDPILVDGQHATGLLQTLPSTYAEFATVPGGIWNPVSNAVAAIRYIMSTYGSPWNIPGIMVHDAGYASGTMSAAPGWALVGERGPEWMRFRGGEQVIPAGAAGGSTYIINVHASPLAQPADIGRQVVGAIRAHEKRSGKGWRTP